MFDTVSYFFVLLDTLDTFIYNTFGSLFHTFSLLRFIMPDKSHAHTRTNTHTHREQQLLCREEDTLLVKLLSVALLNGSMNLMKV